MSKACHIQLCITHIVNATCYTLHSYNIYKINAKIRIIIQNSSFYFKISTASTLLNNTQQSYCTLLPHPVFFFYLHLYFE